MLTINSGKIKDWYNCGMLKNNLLKHFKGKR